MIYEFDACVLDTGLQQLWRDQEPVHVEPQVLAVLEHLAANNDRVITQIELLDEVWGDRFVAEVRTGGGLTVLRFVEEATER